MNHRKLRKALTNAVSILAPLNEGTSGNASILAPDATILIWPSGMKEFSPKDVVQVRQDGKLLDTNRRPSSELAMHQQVYLGRDRIHAVVHTHPPYATALAMVGKALPAVHYEIAFLGANGAYPEIPCLPFELPGSLQLAKKIRKAYEILPHCAFLLANHGMIVAADTLAEAIDLSFRLEALVGMYMRSLVFGKLELLPGEVLDSVAKIIRSGYGQQK